MVPSHQELSDAIFQFLFRQTKSPEELEHKYRGRPVTFDDIWTLKKGTRIITSEGEYILQKDKSIPCVNVPIKTVFYPEFKVPLEIIGYSKSKRARMKEGRNPYDLCSDLAREIRTFLIPEAWAEDAEEKIPARRSLGIDVRSGKRVKRLVMKRLSGIGLDRKKQSG